MVDTPMSPPPEEQGQIQGSYSVDGKAKLPNSPWTRLQTTFKEWELRRIIQWQIAQTV